MMIHKTLPLLMAGLVVSAGAFAQSSSGSSGSYSTQPGASSVGSPSGSTSSMGSSAAPDVVVVQPAVPVPVAVPVYVQRDARSERYTGNRAVDTGNGTLESNMGPYDPTWRNPDRGRAGSY
jgi:hypothetical protein